MTKRAIEKRLAALRLRLERDGAHWIIRPDTVGPCMLRQVIPLRRLADAETVIDLYEITNREAL